MNTDNMENTIESGSIEIISVELQSASLNSETVDLENSNLETESLSLQGNIETGIPGKDGVSVIKVEQIQTATEPGGINKIRIYLSDNSTFDFTVKNGTKYTLTDEDKQTIVTAVNAIISPTLNTKADKSEIPTKVSQLTNDKGYLTQHQSLVGYAKTTDLPTKLSQLFNDCNYLTQHQSLSEYLTKALAEQLYQPKGNYLTEHQSLAEYAKTVNLPTKTSQLTNDSGYLTSHQSLASYLTIYEASTTYQPKGNYLTQHQDISGKQDVISDLEDIRNKANSALQEHQSLDGYVPKISDEPITIIASEGNITIGNIENPFDDFFSGIATLEGNTYIRGGEIEFNGSIKVSGNEFKFNNVNVATERWVEEQQYIDISALNGYATQKWVEDKKYLTTHQDISGKANIGDSYTKTESDGKYLTSHQDISGKVDKIEGKEFLNSNGHTSVEETNVTDSTTGRTGKYEVIQVKTSGGKKMVYGMCTDQVDGTGFIGGLFAESAASFPYSQGLAIGGSTKNLLYLSKPCLASANVIATTGKALTGFSTSNGVTTFTSSTFITEHQDISGKANTSDVYTKTEVNTKLSSKLSYILDTENNIQNINAEPECELHILGECDGYKGELGLGGDEGEGGAGVYLYSNSAMDLSADEDIRLHAGGNLKLNGNIIATEEYVDNKIGDIETLLDNIIGE